MKEKINRSRRIRQRPRTCKIGRHLDQPMLWPEPNRPGAVFGNRRVRVEEHQRGEVTSYGGLALAHELAMRLGLDKQINDSVRLLTLHVPYHESDHILTHVYNLYIGGRCIEDIGHIQHSDAIKSLLGACRIPDPTTAGDFLRRFDDQQLDALQNAIDQIRQKVWRQLSHRNRQTATIDMDSTIKEVYGECKQGADFSYNGKWSYHPLLLTLCETNEPLRTINRSGNVVSEDGAADALVDLLPMLNQSFKQVRVRGDSKFYRRAIIAQCIEHDAQFALVVDPYPVLNEIAEALPAKVWKVFSAKASVGSSKTVRSSKRRKRHRHRRRIARERGYKTLKTTKMWTSEFEYTLPRQRKAIDHDMHGQRFRMVVKRQLIEVSEGQEKLFEEYRYRFVITNIPTDQMDCSGVLRFLFGRCDQENIIQQMKTDLAAMRMPTGELLANGAFLMMGQLAWCLRAWLSLLALPRSTLRWQWPWFRHAFVYVAATISRHARHALVRLTRSHRFVKHLLIASQRLRCLEFR